MGLWSPNGTIGFQLTCRSFCYGIFALCMQCGATVAIINQELNWVWALSCFVGLSVLAQWLLQPTN